MSVAPTLDHFQQEALSFLAHADGRAVVADPMGSRKTGTVLAWAAQWPVARLLVIAPKAVHGHWAREAAKFHPRAIVQVGKGSKAKRLKAIMDVAGPYPQLYITTYESMKADQAHLLAAKFGAVVFDEGHKLKGRTTQVALSANEFAKACEHCIIVTGTPVVNHASELWQYLHMMAPDVYTVRGVRRFWLWAEEHFVIELAHYRNARFPVKVIHGFRQGHEEIVRNQISPWFIQRSYEEMFPGEAWIVEPEHVEIEVELSAAERKVYDNLVTHKWGIVGDTEVMTQNALDLKTRLTQISSDWGTLDESLALGTKSEATVELVLDLLEREERVVVFVKYKATMRRLTTALRHKGVVTDWYSGDESPTEHDECVQRFASGKTDVIVGTLDAMSEGVDGLQHKCSNVIFLDRYWTSTKNEQAVGRLRRSGQVQVVNVYHVFAKDTVDATITAACLRKQNVINMIEGRPLVDVIYGRV